MKLFVLVFVASFFAIAEESEFRGKIQEDMDDYKKSIQSNCGVNVEMIWKGGKLGANPRESGVTSLCTSGLSAIQQACGESKVVQAELTKKKIKKINCDKGKGNISYKIDGDSITVFIDIQQKITQENNPAGQTDLLKKKIIADLDT